MAVLTKVISRFDAAYNEGSTSKLGSSDREIARVAQSIGIPLCEAHIELLQWMGKDYHGYFVGTDIFTRDIESNTGVLPELFEEEGIADFSLVNLVCFYCHQGYVFAWYYSDGTADPMVHFFKEIEGGFVITSDQRFSEFIEDNLSMR